MTARLADHRDEIERLYFEHGESYQEIADRFGKSREAVRQFLNRYFPGRTPGRTFRQGINEQERLDRETAEEEARRAEAEPCVICGDPVVRGIGGRGKHKTCSPEHSRLWASARFLLDPSLREKQRISIAQSTLRYADDRPASAVKWARKVVNGEPINTRTYTIIGSKAQAAYEEVMRIRKEKGYRP